MSPLIGVIGKLLRLYHAVIIAQDGGQFYNTRVRPKSARIQNASLPYFRYLPPPTAASDDGKDAMITLLEGLVGRAYRLVVSLTSGSATKASEVSDWLEEVRANGVKIDP